MTTAHQNRLWPEVSSSLPVLAKDTIAASMVIAHSNLVSICNSMRGIEFRIPLPDTSYMPIIVGIGSLVQRAPGHLHQLMEMSRCPLDDYLDREQLMPPGNIRKRWVTKGSGWALPLVGQNGNMFVLWNLKAVLFNKIELFRLHWNLFHLRADKLYNIQKRGFPEKCHSKVKKL